jgi:probable lipoprotein NlpC
LPLTRLRRIEFASLLVLAFGLTATAPAHEGRAESQAGPGATRMKVVAQALSWRGAPYRFGGHTRKGVDCSGFVHEVLVAAGVPGPLPRKSSSFQGFGEEVGGGVEPGDILLFAGSGSVDHVGIALSDEAFIHAASEGPRTGVIVSSLEEETWKSRFVAARRIVGGMEW